MIHFRDMTFCINPNCTCNEGRKLTDEIRAAAEKWWGKPGAPICMGDICGAKKEEESCETPLS